MTVNTAASFDFANGLGATRKPGSLRVTGCQRPGENVAQLISMDQTQQLMSTATLLKRVRGGDPKAKERLVAIYMPILTHWAKGRLPGHARSLAETQDLVQATLIRALEKVDSFESYREGAFLAYMRRTLMNLILNEIRRPQTQTAQARVSPDELPVGTQTPDLDQLIQYDEALSKLKASDREGIILRLEFGLSYGEIAAAMRKPSANASRMFVSRALVNFAEQMG
jgi:RNA polymerase sigma-70 factor (ECF subfamily)